MSLHGMNVIQEIQTVHLCALRTSGSDITQTSYICECKCPHCSWIYRQFLCQEISTLPPNQQGKPYFCAKHFKKEINWCRVPSGRNGTVLRKCIGGNCVISKRNTARDRKRHYSTTVLTWHFVVGDFRDVGGALLAYLFQS